VPSGTPVPTVAATARPTQTPTPEPAAEAFSLTSPAFADGKAIPARYTCDGRDVSPPLTWTGLPDATVALLLTMHDPDAGGFLHWIAWNIPADVDHLAAGASGDLPKGAGEGRNDFPSGGRGYRGPCPPSGRHRYVLTLYALPIRLPDAASTPADQLESAAREVALGTATLHGTYRRP
jgi:Raf kinase inhibitor-like YbhB/YbcL family protein